MTERRSLASRVYRLVAKPAVFRLSVALVSLCFGLAVAAEPTWGEVFASDSAFFARVAVGIGVCAAGLGLLTKLVATPAAEAVLYRHNGDPGAHHVALSEMSLQLQAVQRELAELSAQLKSLKERLEP